MRRLIVGIGLITAINCTSQISSGLEDFIKPFEGYESFNAMGRKNDSISKLLSKKATDDELIYLSLHGKNIFTKGIAIETLANRKSEKVIAVYEHFIDSKDTVVFSSGCLSSKASLPNFVFQLLTFNRNYSEEELTYNREMLVRKILNKIPVNVDLLESIHYWIPPSEEFYEPLRKIVVANRSPLLLVTIAKYKKEDDIELIKSFGADAFPAIEEFPDEQFGELLERYILFDDFQYMFALVKSCTPETVKTVEKVIALKIEDIKEDDCGNFCLSTIYNQIEMNNCELFYPALEKLWLSNKIISFNILDQFKKHHSEKEIADYIFNGLMLPGEAEIIDKNVYDMTNFLSDIESGIMYNTGDRLAHVLRELKIYSNEQYIEALEKNVLEIDDLGLPEFVDALNDDRSLKQIKNTFIQKMKANDSAYGLFSIMEAIKLFNDKETFKKGFEIIKQRRNEFREKWEDSLREFLQEHRLKLD